VPNGEPLSQVRLRLLRAGDRQPLTGPAGGPRGGRPAGAREG
jgi:hypothetical protein